MWLLKTGSIVQDIKHQQHCTYIKHINLTFTEAEVFSPSNNYRLTVTFVSIQDQINRIICPLYSRASDRPDCPRVTCGENEKFMGESSKFPKNPELENFKSSNLKYAYKLLTLSCLNGLYHLWNLWKVSLKILKFRKLSLIRVRASEDNSLSMQTTLFC